MSIISEAWAKEDHDWLGCGTYDHGPDCLCDVVIPEQTDKRQTVILDYVNDMFMGRQICDIQGYCVPWTSSKFADYLTDLGIFNDALKASKDNLPQSEADMDMLNNTSLVGMAHCRLAVKQSLERMAQPSIESALNECHIDGYTFVRAVTTNHNKEKILAWTTERLIEFEQELLLGKYTVAGMREKYFMTDDVFYNLKEYFKPVFDYHKIPFNKGQSLERSQAKIWIGNAISSGTQNNVIISEVQQRFGITYTTSAISKIRVRKPQDQR